VTGWLPLLDPVASSILKDMERPGEISVPVVHYKILRLWVPSYSFEIGEYLFYKYTVSWSIYFQLYTVLQRYKIAHN
jgi:hypothetical protein